MLELDRLTRRFGDAVARDELSLTVEPGQVLGFVGPNGAGKTTAMRIALGVLEPDAGGVARPRQARRGRRHHGLDRARARRPRASS